jgi:predicted ribosomally synthesized peptide with SipW-like signal peptide
MQKKTKQKVAAASACAMAAAMGVAGTLAYLTDNETHTNTFSLGGDVEIDLTEPNWDQTDANGDGVPDAAEDLTPNGEVVKDPMITNFSDNDVVVFMRVTVPVKDVTKIDNDGTIMAVDYAQTGETNVAWSMAAADTNGNGVIDNGETPAHSSQELFYFKKGTDAIGTKANNFDSNWVQLTDEEDVFVDGTNRTANWDPALNDGEGHTLTGAGQRTYVFGYKTKLGSKKELGEDSADTYTSKLFEKVQLKNIIENEVAADQIQNIKVEAFAIQADNIIGASGSAIDTSGTLEKTTLEEIYDIYVKQNGEISANGDMQYNNYQDSEHGMTEKEANVNNVLNLKGDGQIGSRIHVSAAPATLYMNPETGEATTSTITVTFDTKGKDSTGADDAVKPGVGANNGTNGVYSTDESVATVANDNGVLKVTPHKIGDTTIVVETKLGAKAAVHISVQRDSRVVDGLDASNNASNLPEGTSEP